MVVKTHTALSGREKGHQVACKATKRKCPISDDENHMYFANMSTVKKYNSIVGEFPEFSERGALSGVIDAGMDEYPIQADDRIDGIFKSMRRLKGFQRDAEHGKDISKSMDDGVIADAGMASSALWDDGGGLRLVAGHDSMDLPFGRVDIHGDWERKFLLGSGRSSVDSAVIGNGHSIVSLREAKGRDGKEIAEGLDARVTTKDNPCSSIRFLMNRAGDDGSVSFDDDGYGKALDDAVDSMRRETHDRERRENHVNGEARDVTLNIDDDHIRVDYDYDDRPTRHVAYHDVDEFEEDFPATTRMLDEAFPGSSQFRTLLYNGGDSDHYNRRSHDDG